MKTLLVPVASHDALPSVFETAILTARRFGSLIEGVSLRPALAEYVPVDMVGGMTWLRDEEADKVEAERGRPAVHRLHDPGRRAARGRGPVQPGGPGRPVRATAGGPTCRPATASSGQYARLFTATVVGRPGTEDGAPRMTTFETALFESGRPILLAPPIAPATLGEAILIAWNGSTETARAVAFAMPFLRQAKRIRVISVEGGTVPGPTAEELARALACEGIERRFPRPFGRPADARARSTSPRPKPSAATS